MAQKKHFIVQCKGLVPILGILFALISCGDTKQKSEDLEQAFKIHNEAVKLRRTVDAKMAQLKSNTDSLFMATNTKNLDAIGQSLETWDDQLVEVPGFEHEHEHEHDHSGHDHDHEHDHDHDHEQELTPKQHLEVQQQLLEDLKAIAEKIERIK